MTSKKELNFEQAFTRLEEILESMNSGATGLDQSLKLYEEADALIRACGTRLNEAERKVQQLIKNRSGDIVTDANGQPQMEDYNTGNGN